MLPLAAIVVSYYLAVRHGRVPACNPFLDGCTSISATGRYEPASYVFKPAHLLVAGLLAVFWNRPLRIGMRGPRLAPMTRLAGLVAAGALVVYTLTLGSQTPLYEFMRRFGIYFFFAGTVLAQLLATIDLRANHASLSPAARSAFRCMVAACLAPAVLGIVNFAQKALLADPGHLENRIEWITTVLMQAWFLFLSWYLQARDGRQPDSDR